MDRRRGGSGWKRWRSHRSRGGGGGGGGYFGGGGGALDSRLGGGGGGGGGGSSFTASGATDVVHEQGVKRATISCDILIIPDVVDGDAV